MLNDIHRTRIFKSIGNLHCMIYITVSLQMFQTCRHCSLATLLQHQHHSTAIITSTLSGRHLLPAVRSPALAATGGGFCIKAHGFFQNTQDDDGIMITINLANKEENAASIEFCRKRMSINLRQHTVHGAHVASE